MMPIALARRYSRALFKVARDADQVDRARDDLATLATVMAAQPDFMRVLAHPGLGFERKEKLVRSAFEGRLHELTLHFLLLTLKKRREALFPLLGAQFDRLVADWRNELTAEVRSAIVLNDEERRFISRTLGEITGRNVVLEEKVDPAILGGLIIQYGDKQIDGSIRHHLSEMRKELMNVRVTGD